MENCKPKPGTREYEKEIISALTHVVVREITSQKQLDVCNCDECKWIKELMIESGYL